MSRIETYRASVAQSAKERATALEQESKALREARQELEAFRLAVQEIPEQIAARLMPAAEAMEALIRSTAQELRRVAAARKAADEAREDIVQTTSLLEVQTRRLLDAAQTNAGEAIKAVQKGWGQTVAAAVMAGVVAAAMGTTWSAWSSSPSPQQMQLQQIGRRVLEVRSQTDERTRAWIDSVLVQPQR